MRDFFESRLAQAVAAAHGASQPLSVLWVDVDEVQEANDAHGPEAVDGALSAVVEELAAELDGRGPVGQVSGAAFVAYMRGAPAAEGAHVAEALRRRLARRPFQAESGAFHLTVSVGVAGLRPAEPYGNLLEAAEVACRKAKQAGRDRVVVR